MMSDCDREGYKIEAAMQAGFTPHSDDDDVFCCTPEQISKLIDMVRNPKGWALMPVECTDEIAEAIAETAHCCGGIAESIWSAAVAAVGGPVQRAKSELGAAHGLLVHAAERFEDACHVNETMMDASVDDANANRLATELRVRATAFRTSAKEIMA